MMLEMVWIVPLFLSKSNILPSSYTNSDVLGEFSYFNLLDGLTGYHSLFPIINSITIHHLPWYMFIFPIVVAIGFRRVSSQIFNTAVLCYLLFAMLVIGKNLPFLSINEFIFNNIPTLNLYRDPSPYFVGIESSLTVLIGLVLTSYKVFNDDSHTESSNKNKILSIHTKFPKTPLFVIPILLFMLFSSSFPVATNKIDGTLIPKKVPNSVQLVNQYISSSSPGAVLCIPNTSQFALNTWRNPNIQGYAITSTLGIDYPVKLPSNIFLSTISDFYSLSIKYNIKYVVLSTMKADFESVGITDNTLLRLLERTSLPNTDRRIIGKYIILTFKSSIKYPIESYNMKMSQSLIKFNNFNLPFELSVDSSTLTPAASSVHIGSSAASISVFNVAKCNCQKIIVLWQKFDNQWFAINSSGEKLHHIRINGWANGFLEKSSETDMIKIVFKSQRYLNYGLLISDLALILYLTYVTSTFIKLDKNRHPKQLN